MTAAEIAILLSAKNTAKGILAAAMGDVGGLEKAIDGAARTSRTASAQMEGDMRRIASATKSTAASAGGDFAKLDAAMAELSRMTREGAATVGVNVGEVAAATEGAASRATGAAAGMGSGVSVGAGLATMALAGAGIGAGLMAGQFLQSSSEAATNFESMTTRIAHNAGLNVEQTDAMRKAIVDLNLETGQPLDQLASGYMHVVDVTHNVASAQDILTVATKAATAAGGDSSHYANILALAMHEYGTDTSNAATAQERQAEVQANASKTMNIFRQAAMDSNLTLEDFADHTARVTGLAARLGIPLEDVDAAYASLTKRGFDAAQAQTQLVGAMTHMINPTKASQKEIAALSQATGIDLVHDFSAAGLSTDGLDHAMNDLTLALEKQGLSQAEATTEAMKLVNAQRGGLGVAALATNAQQDYNDELAKLQDTAGIATTMNDQYNDTLDMTQNKLDRTSAKFDLLKRNIGEGLMPAENQLLDTLLDPRGAWNKDEQNMDGSSDAMDRLQGKLEHMVDGMPAFASGVGDAFSTLGGTVNTVINQDIGGAFDNLGFKAHDTEIGLQITTTKMANDIAGMVRNADSWLSNLAGNLLHDIGLQGQVDGYAEGTDYAPGGVALVGERGPELVRLPRGSQVIPNHRLGSEARAGSIDYERLAKAIARALPQPSLRGEAMARAEQRRMGQTLAVLQGQLVLLERSVAGQERTLRLLESRTVSDVVERVAA